VDDQSSGLKLGTCLLPSRMSSGWTVSTMFGALSVVQSKSDQWANI